MFPGRSTPRPSLHQFEQPQNRPYDLVESLGRRHPAAPASASTVGPSDEMSTGTLSESATRRIHNALLAVVFGESGAFFGRPLPWSAGLTQCGERRGSPEKCSGAVEVGARECAFAVPWKRTHAGFIGVEWANRRRTKPLRRAAPNVARSRHADGTGKSRRSQACCSCSVGGIAMHTSWTSYPDRRANDADRSRQLPLSPCQTNPIKSDLRRTGAC